MGGSFPTRRRHRARTLAQTSRKWRSRSSTRKRTKSSPGSTPTIAATPPGPDEQSSLPRHHANSSRDRHHWEHVMTHHIAIRLILPPLGAALALAATTGRAQPRFGNPSPTAGSDTSQRANDSADQALYAPVEYTNAKKRGPAVIVIPGEIKSNNATFLQKFTANNIADFGEVELASANFPVLERANLGPVLKEFELAYNLGDPDAARKFLRMGKLKSTKYVVKFDILKAEQIASAQQGFDGRTLGQMAGILGGFSGSRGGAQAGAVGGTAIGSVHSNEATSVWVIGMRYKVINA